jgi:hypothetical protein
LDLLLLLERLTTTLPSVKIIGCNDPQAISDLWVLTGLGHLQDMPRTPPICFWGSHCEASRLSSARRTKNKHMRGDRTAA